MRHLTHAQVAALAGACSRSQTFIRVLAESGLRRGEASTLQVQGIEASAQLRGQDGRDEPERSSTSWASGSRRARGSPCGAPRSVCSAWTGSKTSPKAYDIAPENKTVLKLLLTS